MNFVTVLIEDILEKICLTVWLLLLLQISGKFGTSQIYELQNEFKTVTLGMYFSKKPISLGVWFRNRSFTFSTKSYDAFIVSIGLNLPLKNERYLKLTYSIDFTISKLRTSSFGTNELSLIYNLDNRYLLKKSQAKQAKKAMY